MWRKRTKGESDNDSDIPVNPTQIMKAHGEKVFDAIRIALNSLDNNENAESWTKYYYEMGYNHYKYGARYEHLKVSFVEISLFLIFINFNAFLIHKIDNRRSVYEYYHRRSER